MPRYQPLRPTDNCKDAVSDTFSMSVSAPQLWLRFKQFSFHPRQTSCLFSGIIASWQTLLFIFIFVYFGILFPVHATLPVRFPFRISRVTIGCGLFRFNTFPYYLLKVKLFTAPYGRTTIELLTGVPVAKTTPRPPVISSM